MPVVSAVVLVAVAAGAAFALAARLPAPAPAASSGATSLTSSPSVVPTASASGTPTVETTVSAPATITVMGVGDMIFDRQVATLIARNGGTAPLSAVASLLASADVTVGNLESPLSDRGSAVPGKDPTFRGDPRALAGLRAAGFDLLSLANNHIRDYGPEALLDTVARLDRAGIAHAGAGEDRASAWRPAIVDRGGVKVAYLAYSSVVPTAFAAGTDRPGLAATRIDRAAVRRAIRTAAKKADVVIVSFHWGVEYKDDANAEQVSDAHAAIDAGADLVLAHHPHVIQALERYKRGLIAYSLGDFVFDHYSRKTGEAFVLSAEVGPHGVGAVTVVPVYLDTWGSPEVVKGQAARSILSRLKTVSARRGTTLGIAGSRATVAP